ncbi:MAG: BMP family ABC transporter substrate-binding protein [Thermotogae bacterium]|nr:BMP family ABC transporter substrate-binding protein [Thermotogota bacterium]
MKRFLVFVLLILSFVVSAYAFKVIMVTDTGGLGDKSFNDGTWAGVMMAAEEFGLEANVIQSYEQADYIPNLTKAAQEADVVFAVGFMMTDALFKVAPQFPGTYFVGIDIVPPEGAEYPNVMTFTFKENEAAFLVGYVAAAMTKSNIVGFIGGIPIPPVERFRYGFEAGVRTYCELHDKDVQILKGYTMVFDDPKKGKDLAMSQFAEGADIIFHASGACGNGVIEAAKEKFSALAGTSELVGLINYYWKNGKGLFAMGVDADQDYLAPGAVLASAMKRVDMAAYYGVKDAFEGTFEGGMKVLGLKEKGVSISPMKYTKGLIPNRVIAELYYLIKMVDERKLNIPITQEELDSFEVPEIEFPF